MVNGGEKSEPPTRQRRSAPQQYRKKKDKATTLIEENVECADGVGCEQVIGLNAVYDGGDSYSEYQVLSIQNYICTNMNRK